MDLVIGPRCSTLPFRRSPFRRFPPCARRSSLWPRRSFLWPRRSWFGFGCACLGSCLFIWGCAWPSSITSCPWSPTRAADVGAPCSSCRYSFRKPFLTSLSNWNPNVKQLRRLWPKVWWNSHQVSLLGPSLLSVFSGDFSLFATLGIAFFGSCPSLRLPCLIRLLLSRGFLLCRGLVYPHGLRTTSSPRSGRVDTSPLFRQLFFCGDEGYCSATDLTKRLRATPYQGITKRS